MTSRPRRACHSSCETWLLSRWRPVSLLAVLCPAPRPALRLWNILNGCESALSGAGRTAAARLAMSTVPCCCAIAAHQHSGNCKVSQRLCLRAQAIHHSSAVTSPAGAASLASMLLVGAGCARLSAQALSPAQMAVRPRHTLCACCRRCSRSICMDGSTAGVHQVCQPCRWRCRQCAPDVLCPPCSLPRTLSRLGCFSTTHMHRRQWLGGSGEAAHSILRVAPLAATCASVCLPFAAAGPCSAGSNGYTPAGHCQQSWERHGAAKEHPLLTAADCCHSRLQAELLRPVCTLSTATR